MSNNKTGLSINRIELPEQQKMVSSLKKKISNSKCIRINFNLPKKIHTQFKIKAAVNGKNIKDVLTDYILKYIEKTD